MLSRLHKITHSEPLIGTCARLAKRYRETTQASKPQSDGGTRKAAQFAGRSFDLGGGA